MYPPGGLLSYFGRPGQAVYISGDFNGWQQNQASLDPIWSRHCARFFLRLKDGDQYLFYIDDPAGTNGFKRDPHTRELTFQPANDLAEAARGRQTEVNKSALELHVVGRSSFYPSFFKLETYASSDAA